MNTEPQCIKIDCLKRKFCRLQFSVSHCEHFFKPTTYSTLLTHRSDADKAIVDKLDAEIYTLQGRCESYKDTEKLADLYRRRHRIVSGIKPDGCHRCANCQKSDDTYYCNVKDKLIMLRGKINDNEPCECFEEVGVRENHV